MDFGYDWLSPFSSTLTWLVTPSQRFKLWPSLAVSLPPTCYPCPPNAPSVHCQRNMRVGAAEEIMTWNDLGRLSWMVLSFQLSEKYYLFITYVVCKVEKGCLFFLAGNLLPYALQADWLKVWEIGMGTCLTLWTLKASMTKCSLSSCFLDKNWDLDSGSWESTKHPFPSKRYLVTE